MLNQSASGRLRIWLDRFSDTDPARKRRPFVIDKQHVNAPAGHFSGLAFILRVVEHGLAKFPPDGQQHHTRTVAIRLGELQ
jgi:hypothetical protein